MPASTSVLFDWLMLGCNTVMPYMCHRLLEAAPDLHSLAVVMDLLLSTKMMTQQAAHTACACIKQQVGGWYLHAVWELRLH